MTQTITPNDTPVTANDQNAVPSLESLAAKMDAMRSMTQRNQLRATEQTETGESTEANVETPVAPEGEEIFLPEVATLDNEDQSGTEEATAQEEPVSQADADSTAEELIDFIEFAETNPNAKFKFMRNGKEVVIDAKKAAAILGQGGAIHEEARQLKIEKSEFEEYLKEQRSRQEGLTLAMEFTVEPRLRQAYDEIIKTQGYQQQFQQQLQSATDAATRARIQANMAQNERYIQQQGQIVNQLKPAIDQFYEIRKEQVTQVLDQRRKSFKDKELKNEYIFNELRDKLTKGWEGAQAQMIPGVSNLDLVSSDEFLMGLIRDGMKFRDRPRSTGSGTNTSALTTRKSGSSVGSRTSDNDISNLRERAKGGDKKAADNLLVAQLTRLRQSRTSR